MLWFGSFTAELLIADACDGDAASAEFAETNETNDHSNPEGSSQEPGHSMHVCHCVHAHGGFVTAPAGVPVIELVATVVGFDSSAPRVPLIDRDLRPPIV
jgi:hypothetical protein